MGRTRNFEQVSGGGLDMESQLLAGLSKFKWYAGRFMRDDDFADRLSHTVSSSLLVLFTLIISARQYIGKPIACWVPSEFTRAQEEYAESVCWVTSTYFVEPLRGRNGVGNHGVFYQGAGSAGTSANGVPHSIDEREASKLLYYQWVPFILMGQALLFNIPCIIWRLFNWHSGINLVSVMQVACDVDVIKDKECRRINIGYIANHLDQSLRAHRPGILPPKKRLMMPSCSPRVNGCYLLTLYLLTKLFYLSNIVLQLFLMGRVLGANAVSDYPPSLYGFALVRELARGRLWHQSGHFPRITMCDFVIRKLANSHRYTVQCVLPINMFNEKIFIFLWFWLVLVGAVTLASFFSWIYRLLPHYNRLTFVNQFLRLRHQRYQHLDQCPPKKKCLDFVESHLRYDGIFVLRLLAQNAGDLIACEVTDSLWKLYLNQSNPNAPPNNLTPTAPPIKVKTPSNASETYNYSVNNSKVVNRFMQRKTPLQQPLNTDKNTNINNNNNNNTNNSSNLAKSNVPLTKEYSKINPMSNNDEDPGEFV